MITLIKVGNGYVQSKHMEFLIDSSDDVENLPTASGLNACTPGSVAYTPDLSTVYILGNDGEWHVVSV